jgi:hypothetical protein
MRCALLWALLPLSFASFDSLAGPRVLPMAHAHNDYLQVRPLFDALDHGFMSAEADICLIDGELLVGHEIKHCRPGRSLESLYLVPLAKRVRANGGRVHRGGPREFQLLVDFKTSGMPTYRVLEPLLERYRWMLTSFEGGKRKPGAVLVVLSGSRPQEHVASLDSRLCALDGWFGDLRRPAQVVPLLSDRWSKHFRWRGNGPMPIDERIRLRDYVRRAHAGGRKIRFWAVPHHPEVWRAQLEEGVDWLNLDDMTRSRRFLLRWLDKPTPRRRTAL